MRADAMAAFHSGHVQNDDAPLENDEEKALGGLLQAFTHLTLKDIATAYTDAKGDPDRAAAMLLSKSLEELGAAFPQASRGLVTSAYFEADGNLNRAAVILSRRGDERPGASSPVREDEAPEASREDWKKIPKEAKGKSSKGKKKQSKNAVVESPQVGTVKQNLTPVKEKPGKPIREQNPAGNTSAPSGGVGPSSLVTEEADFIYAMLGQHLEIDKEAVDDIIAYYQGDLSKSLDTLLSISREPSAETAAAMAGPEEEGEEGEERESCGGAHPLPNGGQPLGGPSWQQEQQEQWLQQEQGQHDMRQQEQQQWQQEEEQQQHEQQQWQHQEQQQEEEQRQQQQQRQQQEQQEQQKQQQQQGEESEDEAMRSLLEMFPETDPADVVMLFQANRGDKEATVSALLSAVAATISAAAAAAAAASAGAPATAVAAAAAAAGGAAALPRSASGAGIGTRAGGGAAKSAFHKELEVSRLQQAFPLVEVQALREVFASAGESYRAAFTMLVEAGVTPVPGAVSTGPAHGASPSAVPPGGTPQHQPRVPAYRLLGTPPGSANRRAAACQASGSSHAVTGGSPQGPDGSVPSGTMSIPLSSYLPPVREGSPWAGGSGVDSQIDPRVDPGSSFDHQYRSSYTNSASPAMDSVLGRFDGAWETPGDAGANATWQGARAGAGAGSGGDHMAPRRSADSAAYTRASGGGGASASFIHDALMPPPGASHYNHPFYRVGDGAAGGGGERSSSSSRSPWQEQEAGPRGYAQAEAAPGGGIGAHWRADPGLLTGAALLGGHTQGRWGGGGGGGGGGGAGGEGGEWGREVQERDWEVEAQQRFRMSQPSGPGPGPLFRQGDVAPDRGPPAAPSAGDVYYQKQRSYAFEQKRMRDYYFREARTAYIRGERARAASLADEGRDYAVRFNDAQKRAGERLFAAKNKSINNNITIDLHQLHVEEALQKTEQHLTLLTSLPTITSLTIICGHGRHSAGGQARVKPAVGALSVWTLSSSCPRHLFSFLKLWWHVQWVCSKTWTCFSPRTHFWHLTQRCGRFKLLNKTWTPLVIISSCILFLHR